MQFLYSIRKICCNTCMAWAKIFEVKWRIPCTK